MIGMQEKVPWGILSSSRASDLIAKDEQIAELMVSLDKRDKI